MTLGHATARELAPWDVRLAGGTVVGRGGYELKVDREDYQKVEWLLKYTALNTKGEPMGDAANIARIWREGTALKFQWDENAPKPSAAKLLDCIMTVDVDGLMKKVVFVEPVMVEPIVVDLKTATSKPIPIELANVPDKSRLRFEVTRIEGLPQQLQKKPAEPVPAGETQIVGVTCVDFHSNHLPGVGWEFRLIAGRSGLILNRRTIIGQQILGQTFAMCPAPADANQQLEAAKKKLAEAAKRPAARSVPLWLSSSAVSPSSSGRLPSSTRPTVKRKSTTASIWMWTVSRSTWLAPSRQRVSSRHGCR